MISEDIPKTVLTAQGPVEYYEEGSGPSVLCIHGALGGYDQSISLARTIGPPGYRYIAVSRPGYLGTPIASGRTPKAQGDLHAALLDALKIDSAVVMAISGGGPSALCFALNHPQRCRRLILCSTLGGPAKHQKIPLSFHLLTLLAGIRPFVRSVQKKTALNLEAALSRSISDPERVRALLGDEETLSLFKVVLVGSFDHLKRRIPGTRCDIGISASFSCQLERVQVPTLVIHGDKDPLVPFEDHGKRLAEEISGARLCLAEGGEHVAIFTHRRQVRTAVESFLTA